MEFKSIVKREDNRDLIIGILNRIEGYRVRLKELHWSADSDGLHTLIDKVTDTLLKYEDEIAEDYQGISSDFKVGTLIPQLPESVDIKSLIKEMREDIGSLIYLDKELIYSGIRSLSKKFVHKMNIYLYLERRA